jgi:hypothetical protein
METPKQTNDRIDHRQHKDFAERYGTLTEYFGPRLPFETLKEFAQSLTIPPERSLERESRRNRDQVIGWLCEVWDVVLLALEGRLTYKGTRDSRLCDVLTRSEGKWCQIDKAFERILGHKPSHKYLLELAKWLEKEKKVKVKPGREAVRNRTILLAWFGDNMTEDKVAEYVNERKAALALATPLAPPTAEAGPTDADWVFGVDWDVAGGWDVGRDGNHNGGFGAFDEFFPEI